MLSAEETLVSTSRLLVRYTMNRRNSLEMDTQRPQDWPGHIGQLGQFPPGLCILQALIIGKSPPMGPCLLRCYLEMDGSLLGHRFGLLRVSACAHAPRRNEKPSRATCPSCRGPRYPPLGYQITGRATIVSVRLETWRPARCTLPSIHPTHARHTLGMDLCTKSPPASNQ